MDLLAARKSGLIRLYKTSQDQYKRLRFGHNPYTENAMKSQVFAAACGLFALVTSGFAYNLNQ